MYKDDALELVSDLNRTIIIKSVSALLEIGRGHAQSYRDMAEATDARMDALEADIQELVSMVEGQSQNQMKTSVKNILIDAVSDYSSVLSEAANK